MEIRSRLLLLVIATPFLAVNCQFNYPANSYGTPYISRGDMLIPLDANNDRSAFPSENSLVRDPNQRWNAETRRVSYPPAEYDNDMSYDPYQVYKDEYNSHETTYEQTSDYSQTTDRPYNAGSPFYYPPSERPYPGYEQDEADVYSPYPAQDYSTTPHPYQTYTSQRPAYTGYEQNEVDDYYPSYPPQPSTTTKRPYQPPFTYPSETQEYANSYASSYAKPLSSYSTTQRPMYTSQPQYSVTTRRPAYQTTPGYQIRPYSSTPPSYYSSSSTSSYSKKPQKVPQNPYSPSTKPSTHSSTYYSNGITQRPTYAPSTTPCPYHKRPAQQNYSTTTRTPYKQQKPYTKPHRTIVTYTRIPPAKPAMWPVYSVNRRPQPPRYYRRPYGRLY